MWSLSSNSEVSMVTRNWTARVRQLPPSKRFWGINQTITYGSTTIFSNAAGVADTGTTLILIATGE